MNIWQYEFRSDWTEPPNVRLQSDFELIECISVGPRAELWRAVERVSGAEFALKIAAPGRQFNCDAIAVAQLDHPNIVNVMMHGELEDGRAYAVLEHVEGVQLRRFIAVGTLEWVDIQKIVGEIGQALATAHACKIAHGSLSPEHVMLIEGDWFDVRLLGFGTAEIDPVYAAPEQLANERADIRSDIFALAVLVVEMLTGVNPVGLQTLGEQGRRGAIASYTLPPYAQHLQPVLSRALAERPRDRDVTLDELVHAVTGKLPNRNGLARGTEPMITVEEGR